MRLEFRSAEFLAGLCFGYLLSNPFRLLQQQQGMSVSLVRTAGGTVQDKEPYFRAHNDGWNLLHVFYGEPEVLKNNMGIDSQKPLQWVSQARQDEIVADLLNNKQNGYFVDLAARDAIVGSNSYALETRFGWKGICMEAEATNWYSLSHRKCHVAAAVAGNETMALMRFHMTGIGLSSLVGKQFPFKNVSKRDQWRYTISLQDVLERFHAPAVIDYFSLDIEGAELFVMEPFPFDRYRFNVMTIEGHDPQLRELLHRNGYILLKEITIFESVWTHESYKDSLNRSALALLQDMNMIPFEQVLNHSAYPAHWYGPYPDPVESPLAALAKAAAKSNNATGGSGK